MIIEMQYIYIYLVIALFAFAVTITIRGVRAEEGEKFTDTDWLESLLLFTICLSWPLALVTVIAIIWMKNMFNLGKLLRRFGAFLHERGVAANRRSNFKGRGPWINEEKE